MGDRSTQRRFAYVSRAFACLTLCACAGETRERPPDRVTHTAPRAPLAPLPMPSSAFQSDPPQPAPTGPGARVEPPPQSRFDTRRIGASEGDSRPRYRGTRIDLDLKNAELSEVFRLLSDV